MFDTISLAEIRHRPPLQPHMPRNKQQSPLPTTMQSEKKQEYAPALPYLEIDVIGGVDGERTNRLISSPQISG